MRAFASFSGSGDLPLIATAVHNGHDLRPSIDSAVALDSAARRREEDSHTDYFARRFPNHVVVHRSRFEVDINRPRDEAVYDSSEEAFGLDVWTRTLTSSVREDSLRLHDNFYAMLAVMLDEWVVTHGGFVLYDIHSYNHRRRGPDQPADPAVDNPVVNLGTGSLPERWRGVADTFLKVMGSQELAGELIDARENVRFKGREVAAWTHRRYGEVGCALAIELKKVFIDEWTDVVIPERQSQLSDALLATVVPVIDSWADACQ